MASMDVKFPLGIEEVKKFLPHRAPFLLIDRVLSVEPKGNLTVLEGTEDKLGTRVKALKNVTYNEPCFTGHFPSFSIFPGVLTIEAMAQAAAFSFYPFAATRPQVLNGGLSVVLLGVDQVRFRKPILPGDTVIFDGELIKCRKSIWGLKMIASVEGQKVAEAELLANISVTDPSSGKGLL